MADDKIQHHGVKIECIEIEYSNLKLNIPILYFRASYKPNIWSFINQVILFNCL